MFRKNKAHAKIDNNHLILSMPDAETPALWMMDLSDTATTVIRVELDKQGLYVLKKHGGKGASETIGVYRDKRRAVRTLNTITRTLDNARTRNPGSSCHGGLTRTLVIILFIWFALFRLGSLDTLILSIPLAPFTGPSAAQYNQAPTAEEMAEYDAKITEIINRMSPAQLGNAPAPAAPANQAGVPQSADDFLLNRNAQ